MKKFILAVAIFFIAISAQAQTPYKLSQKEEGVIRAIFLEDIYTYLEGGKFGLLNGGNGNLIANIVRISDEVKRVDGVGGEISENSLMIASLAIALAKGANSGGCGIDDRACMFAIRNAPKDDRLKNETMRSMQMLQNSGWGIK